MSQMPSANVTAAERVRLSDRSCEAAACGFLNPGQQAMAPANRGC
jgi:hypothetical protein